MTLTQTADRAALIEELALPADFEGMAESNAAPAMRIRNSCAKLEASPASDAGNHLHRNQGLASAAAGGPAALVLR